MHLSTYRALFIPLALLVLSSCSQVEEKPVLVTLEDAPKVIVKTSVSGVGFDVPLNYLYRGYTKGRGWYFNSRDDIEGKRRATVDFLNLYVTYPDFSPVSKENIKLFQEPGRDKVIMVSFTHFREWGFDFNHGFEFDQSGLRPEDPKAPGMFHYYRNHSDYYTRYNYNASHDRIPPDQTEIDCSDPSFDKALFPKCEITTAYRPSTNLQNLKGINGDMVWEMRMTFSAKYLSNWQEIDKHIKHLFDRFLSRATKS